jgi:hypothetical protein
MPNPRGYRMNNDEQHWGWIVGGLGSIGTFLGVLYGLYQKLKKQKTADERTAIGYYRGIIDRMTSQHAEELQRLRNERDADRVERERERISDTQLLNLHSQQMEDARNAIALLTERSNSCEVEKEILWALAQRQNDQSISLHNFCISMSDVIVKMGHNPGQIPPAPIPLPERPVLKHGIRDKADYEIRVAEQGAKIIDKVKEEIAIEKEKALTDSGRNKKQGKDSTA